MAAASPFHADAGKAVGIEIWRIENMEPKPWPKEQYGHFHTGDCYILLRTYEKFSSLQWDLHFWLGEESSQDERGAAALHTITLDDQLGGGPVQHREVQGHESQQFMSYFHDGIQYLEGGVDSGFRKVDREAFETRLFHLKGKRNVRVQQVPLKTDSLNSGDVFILDCGRKLIQWNGKEANKYEKFKGLEICSKLKDEERGGNAEVIVLDEEKASPEDDLFWQPLGGKTAIKTAEQGGSDEEVKGHAVELLRVSDASGKMEVTKVATASAAGGLERKMLDGNDVFLLDTGPEIFVWVGKGATKEERRMGMQHGQEFIDSQNDRPAWTRLTRVVESGETPAFKAFFQQWDPPRTLNFKDPEKKFEAPSAKVDASELHKKTEEAEEKMVDDATGELQVWRIENFERVEVPKEKYGQFYAGDSYIVLYTYMQRGRKCYIIYFWQGRDSSTDEKAASALFAVQLDDELGGDPVQVRVVQNKEPNHFLALFKGRMVVHEGGIASGFKNRNDTDSYDVDGVSLFHIRGTNDSNTRAVQVAEVASSLNSGDCFVLLSPKVMYVWQGVGANQHEREVAQNIAGLLREEREVQLVEEGSEPVEFWAPLGGKGEYATSKTLEQGEHEPRLFQCTTSKTGSSVSVEEIMNFTQDDLINDDVMILDAFEEVFVWVGHGSNQAEKDSAIRVAFDYVANAPDGRSKDTPIFKVLAGSEPPNFTCHFLGWNDQKASDFTDPYQKKLLEMSGQKPSEEKKGHRKHESMRITMDDVGPYKFDKVISYASLKTKQWPPGELSDELKGLDLSRIDAVNRHLYLSDDEFQAVFKMDKKAFGDLKPWKQKSLKQAAELF